MSAKLAPYALLYRAITALIIVLVFSTKALSQHEVLGLEARGSSIYAHGITVKDSKATVRALGEIFTNDGAGYLIGAFASPNESLLMRVRKLSSRAVHLSATSSRKIPLVSVLALSREIGDKLIVMGGFDLTRDGIDDLVLVDVSRDSYTWFVFSNPLTPGARQMKSFNLGRKGDIPDWYEGRGRSVRFTALRHKIDSKLVTILSTNASGKQLEPANASWVRGFGAITTTQMRLGYRQDLGIALKSLSGDSVMVVTASGHLVRNNVPGRQCAGVRHITKVLRRGDISTFESCPDGRFIVSKRGNYSMEHTDRLVEAGALGHSLYLMRRGDRTDLVEAYVGPPATPTSGFGEIVIPTPTPSPTPSPTPLPTITPTPMNTNVLFEQVRYTTFFGESDVAIADYNSDGFLDIATAAVEGRVDLLLGVGDGTFTQGVHFGAPRANFLAHGDLNGDSRADLVIADYINGALYSFLGNGDGTFTCLGMIDMPGDSQDVELADLNLDGRLDAACVSASTNNLTIFFGNGDGTFTQSQNMVTGSAPFTLEIGDLNGDSKPDVVAADSTSNTLSVFLNLGNGTFGQRDTIAVGPSPNMGDSGDLNGDGKIDLIVTNTNGARFELLLGKGDGTFYPPLSVATQAAPFGAILTDLNRDGWLDVALNTLTHKLNIFLGNGNGTFQGLRSYDSTSSPRFLEAGDFNGDTYPDLAVAQYSTGTIGVFLARQN